MSKRVMDTLARFASDIEIYSINEAFLSLKGFEHKNLTEYGREIKSTVKKWTGIPVSIGIALTKTLAKIANRVAKKSKKTGGVFDITDHPRIDDILKRINVSDIWGIGRQYAKFLKKNGILNAYQLKNTPDQWVKKNLTVTGLRMVKELRGEPCIALEDVAPDKKSILSSKSFRGSVTTLNSLKEAVSAYTARAAEKLRAQKSIASVIQVFITSDPYKIDEPLYYNSAVASLPVPTAYTPELIKYALMCLKKIYSEGRRYKKAGVVFSRLIPDTEIQQDLFTDTKDYDKKDLLIKTIDEINARWGAGSIQTASEGILKPWRMRQDKKSPGYTTSWDDILVVNAH